MILRNVTITIAEIEIPESPARPAGERPESRKNELPPAPLAASVLPEGRRDQAGGEQIRDNPGGGHVDHQDCSPVVISAAAPDRPHGDPVAGGVIDDCESPAAGEKAAPPTGGDHALTVEAEEARSAPPPTVLDEPTVAELLTKVGDQVRAAVANPPPPVELPVELPLRRPVAEDDLAFPPFLVRASA